MDVLDEFRNRILRIENESGVVQVEMRKHHDTMNRILLRGGINMDAYREYQKYMNRRTPAPAPASAPAPAPAPDPAPDPAPASRPDPAHTANLSFSV